MLSFEQIKELIELVAQKRLRGFEIERAGFRFKIDGQAAMEPSSAVTAQPVAASAPAQPPSAGPSPAPAPSVVPVADAEVKIEEADEDTHELTSPIVGTFYRSPSPDADSFVDVGSRVRRGQVLCIVEAMKLMNEIESDVDGEILEILPKNAQPVEFGEPLFRIRTA